MNCPCIDCVCIPICRHKLFHDLFNSCTLIRKYEPHHSLPHLRNEDSIKTIEKVLNPATWKYATNLYTNVKIPMVICL